MINPGTSPKVRQQLRTSCQVFLEEAIQIATDVYRSTKLPRRKIISRIMVPSGPGRHSSKDLTHSELDVFDLWNRIITPVSSTQSWSKARTSLQNYIDIYQIKPTGFWNHHIDQHYLQPLLENYLRRVEAFLYKRGSAVVVIDQMLQDLHTPQVELRGLIGFEGFKAATPFALERNMRIRPISRPELLMLGRNDMWGYQGLDMTLLPQSDWWICEVKVLNPRGTADGWNRIQELIELLALSLRAFKSGGMKIGMLKMEQMSPYGRTETHRGSLLLPLAIGQPIYELSAEETRTFTRFWHKFKRLMGQPQHYLQLPIRRLRAAGGRKEKEDALVDCVVGLEALLGTEEERTELAYRFRIRGAVILAKKRSERRTYLKILGNLYRLRSQIVHGQTVSLQKLNEALPAAEDALRRVWNRYFLRWGRHKNNQAAISWIDGELVG